MCWSFLLNLSEIWDDHFLNLLRLSLDQICSLETRVFWSYWLNLSEIWDDNFFKFAQIEPRLYYKTWAFSSYLLNLSGIWDDHFLKVVVKLLVESERDLRWNFFLNCSDWAEINSVPRNKGVPKLLVESKRDLRWIVLTLLRLSWD